MFVRIAGRTIYGTVLPFLPGPREHHFVATHYPGQSGVSEIQLGTGMRPLQVPIILHHNYTNAQIEAQIKRLQQGLDYNAGWIGTNGKLVVKTDASERSYENCTFDGFVEARDALPDISETLDGGWYCEGLLLFRQLR